MQNYTTEVQKLFLSFMVSDANLYVRVQNIYNPDNFDRSLQKAAKFLQEHVSKFSALPDKAQVLAVTGINLDLLGDDVKQGNIEWFLQEFETFTRHEELKRAILKSADLLEKSEFGPIEKMIKEAVQISLTRDLGIDYFVDPRGRLDMLRNNNGQCPTGWRDLDDKLYGGLNKGELTIFCGGSGSGKSLFLQNLACNWMISGLNGVYITCELSEGLVAMRLDSMLTGIGTRDLFKKIDDVELSIGILGKKSGRLRIKYIPPQSPVNMIRAYIKELQIQCDFNTHFLCTDYLDLLTPSAQKVNASDLFVKDKLVSEELRQLGNEFGLLHASASQLNRSAVDEVEFDHSNIAGGISKINTADNVLGIYRSRAMLERGQIQLQLMKTRSSSGVGSKIDLGYDKDCLRITTIDQVESGPTQTGSEILSRIKPQSSIDASEVAGGSPTGKAEVQSNKLKDLISSLRVQKN